MFRKEQFKRVVVWVFTNPGRVQSRFDQRILRLYSRDRKVLQVVHPQQTVIRAKALQKELGYDVMALPVFGHLLPPS
jgi:hypothetical protein